MREQTELGNEGHITRRELHQWLNFHCPPDDIDRLEQHLETCHRCASLLEELRPNEQSDVAKLRGLIEQGEIGTHFDTEQSTWLDETTNAAVDLSMVESSLGRWELIEKIAEGGIGEVWIANDRLLGRKVAVKRLRETTAYIESIQQRFLHEARITAQLNHPGTVHIIDLVENGSESFYVMTLIRGKTMSELVADYHESASSKLELGVSFFNLLRMWVTIARTVAFAHSRGVLHRDLKSENVVAGEFGQVTLIDWGLAKRISDLETFDSEDSQSEELQDQGFGATRVGARLGTPAFMAPEQARGDIQSLDERTDCYALAGMLYELLTGEPPFVGRDTDSTMAAVVSSQLIEPIQRKPLVPTFLNQICVKGLAKEPRDRFQSANEFADVVENWMTTESTRQQSEVARRKLFDLSDDLMLIFDQTPKVLWANAAWKRVLGWDPQEMVGKVPNFHVHADDIDLDIEVLEKLRRGETATGMKRRSRDTKGDYYWFSWAATPIADEGITCAVGRNIDLMIRREHEFSELISSAPDGVVVINEDQSIYMVSRQVTELFGYTEDELIGQSINLLLPRRFQKSHVKMVKQYMESPVTGPMSMRRGLLGRHKNGEEIPVAIRISPIKTESGVRFYSSIRRET